MSLVPVYQNLLKIESTDSTNAKVDLLKEFLQDKTFLKVIKYALDGDMMYSIKKMLKPERPLGFTKSERTRKRRRFRPKPNGRFNNGRYKCRNRWY